ncbi:MAG: UDP-3-O-acyl-N-acetylglucosamine deacetylase [Rhodospirillaceae bacterium]|jgi:UDP-3-O-[3-hydroxymyristoyl] N-acetylglucosamine deacetylase
MTASKTDRTKTDSIEHVSEHVIVDTPSTSKLNGFRQHTLKTIISCTGIGLHSGSKVKLTLHPAEPDTGILFKRTDVNGDKAIIPASWDNVVDTQLCTTIANDAGTSVATIEHLMAALAGCGIDNAMIEIDGPEVPVMDGSSAPFVFLIECAGTLEQDRPRRAIRIEKKIEVEEDGWYAAITPGDGFSVAFEIDFDSPVVSRQSFTIGLINGTFKRELARARTFGFLHEVEALWELGLAKGGSLENAVVVSGDKILNEDGLRFDDEFVRHKMLDAVGDLYLAGAPLIGHFHGICSGHAANNQLLRAVFADPSNWSYVELRADLTTASVGDHGLPEVTEPALAATA